MVKCEPYDGHRLARTHLINLNPSIHPFLLVSQISRVLLTTKRLKVHSLVLNRGLPKGAWLFWQANSFSEGLHSRITTK